MTPVVDSALKVITEGIKYLTLLSKTSHIRRMRKAVDFGEQFILLHYELGDTEDDRKRKSIVNRMTYCKVKFFKLNQG